MKKLIIILLSIFIFCSSNGQINNNNNIIVTVLTKQLKQGTSLTIDEAGAGLPKIQFKLNELEAVSSIADKILKSNNFKELSNENFIKSIFKIFNRTIDVNSNSIYLYSNFLEKCNREFVMYKNNEIDYEGIFIDKKNKIVFDFHYIPELINYEKDFPDLTNIENIKITRTSSYDNLEIEIPHWKDIPDLDQHRKRNIQILVARNMYLFNDSKAHGLWLRAHDEYFMASLVKTFGYYEDNQLNRWVADKTEFSNKNIEEVNKVIYNKKCDGKIVVNYPVLEIISENDEKATKMFDFFRFDYFDWFSDNKNNLELTFSQKAEIIARLHSFIFSNMKDYRTFDYMGKFAEYNDSENKYSNEFEKHNYYNIPNFKKQWQEAKEDGDGIARPGEE